MKQQQLSSAASNNIWKLENKNWYGWSLDEITRESLLHTNISQNLFHSKFYCTGNQKKTSLLLKYWCFLASLRRTKQETWMTLRLIRGKCVVNSNKLGLIYTYHNVRYTLARILLIINLWLKKEHVSKHIIEERGCHSKTCTYFLTRLENLLRATLLRLNQEASCVHCVQFILALNWHCAAMLIPLSGQE